MTRSTSLTENDLRAVADDLGVRDDQSSDTNREAQQAKARVDDDIASAVVLTPTFFINGRRYEGLWDKTALTDVMLGPGKPSNYSTPSQRRQEKLRERREQNEPASRFRTSRRSAR